MTHTEISMLDLLNQEGSPEIFIPEPGKIVKGAVIFIKDNQVLVDLGGVTTGIIAGSEAVDSLNTLSDLAVGDAHGSVEVRKVEQTY